MDKPSETDTESGPKPVPELDIVAPGEEDLEYRKHDFDRSATLLQSQASGIHREKWGSKMQFLMSCIASAVGLGNVWRFPAVCAKNGGAAFLIPYIIVLFVIARPLFVLELTLGQFSSKGSVRCWDICPALTGIGITGMISSVLLSTFYIMLLAWALIYSVVAIASLCYRPGDVPLWTDDPLMFFVKDVIGGVSFDKFDEGAPVNGIPLCHLAIALIFAWMLIWATMVFGVEASGKVAYVTALAPYGVLIILMIAGVLLEGNEIGLEYLIYPDVAKLIDPSTWFQAVGQCFFSLGIGFGGCIMFSSFNEFNNNIIRDVLIISIVDSVTSLLASIGLMSILGFQATQSFKVMKEQNNLDTLEECLKNRKNVELPLPPTLTKTYEKELKICTLESIVGEGGAGLAFIHYPSAMNKINETWSHPIGTILGLLFFLMLILLAVGSANGFVGTTVTIIADKKPKWKRSNIVSGVCVFSCCLGVIYTNKVGAEWFDVVDWHGVTAVVYVLAFLEVTAIVYIYGLKNFCDDIEFMTEGKKVSFYLIATWICLPFLMVAIYLSWLAEYKSPETWTTAIKVIAWIITVSCLLAIPGTVIAKYFEFKKTPWRRHIPLKPLSIMKAIFMPSPRWGPRDPQLRLIWKEYKSTRDPSFHIWKRLKGCCNRVLRQPETPIDPSPQISYATTATTGARGSTANPTDENTASGSVSANASGLASPS